MVQIDHAHYVPILRWKKAEQIALCKLDHACTARMTPLIELVPKEFTQKKSVKSLSVDETLSKTAQQIFRRWGQASLFIDLWHLPHHLRTEHGEHFLKALSEMCQTYQESLIPVTGLKRDAAYQFAVSATIKTYNQGVCIRLSRDDVQRASLPNDLSNLLSSLKLSPDKVDLLVDLRIIDDSVPSFASLCDRIPRLDQWRTFIVASGAFPKDLSHLEKNRQHQLKRLDWLTWRDQVIASPTLKRRPTYSDYTIQHPIYSEPSEGSNISASIRYTYDEYWVIMRGEGVLNVEGPGSAQWPANAQLLCDRREFCGPSFSYGDKYIKEMSLQFEQTGNATTWLQAGINHHLTFVVHQLANLFGISTVAVPDSEDDLD